MFISKAHFVNENIDVDLSFTNTESECDFLGFIDNKTEFQFELGCYMGQVQVIFNCWIKLRIADKFPCIALQKNWHLYLNMYIGAVLSMPNIFMCTLLLLMLAYIVYLCSESEKNNHCIAHRKNADTCL